MLSITGTDADPVGSENRTGGKLRAVGIGVGLTAAAIVVSLIGRVAAPLAVTGLAYLLEWLDMVPGSVLEEIAAGNPNTLLGLAALSVVVIAPIEEFLFRGVVQGRLRRSFGPVGAVVGSSLLFGSVHLANYTGSLGSVLAGALLIAGTGLVLGIVYELTRNLTIPIVIHAIYNVVLLVSAYLAI